MTWYNNGHNYVHFLSNPSIIVCTKSISYDCDRWVCRRKGSITALPDSKIHATLLQRPGAAAAVMPASGTTTRECRFHITPSKPPHHTDSKDHMLSTKLLKYCILPIIILWFCDYDDYVENCFSWLCPLLKSEQKAGLDYDWWIVQ